MMALDRPLPPGARPAAPVEGWYVLVAPFPILTAILVVLLPVALWAYRRLVRRRTARGATDPRRTALLDVTMVAGTVPLVALTMVPGAHMGEATGAVSLVPLQDLASMPLLQIGGNLLMFTAFGALAPLRFPRLGPSHVVLLAASASTFIETLQHVLRLDRVSSIDDVLLNALGAGAAAVASRVLQPRAGRRAVPSGARRSGG